ncbi:hypothetical protein AVEN_13351-1 [Araneus ventricosus]|uniref:Uncharacterized protein n=1 Tax=Araneus ventricosus TaxID=182803 RepID=A0A4Y2II18_ARAVE|nr:hypothetical protein AVEN_13351-1 [Araneus ventricosus]
MAHASTREKRESLRRALLIIILVRCLHFVSIEGSLTATLIGNAAATGESEGRRRMDLQGCSDKRESMDADLRANLKRRAARSHFRFDLKRLASLNEIKKNKTLRFSE